MVKPALTLLGALLCSQACAAGQVWSEPITGMDFVPVPKGCFRMGTREKLRQEDNVSWKNAGYDGNLAADEAPHHEVCVDAFLIGRHEVRASDWERVMGERPPYGSGAEPAAGVTWHAAQNFAERLTQQAQQSGARYRFRLPTEAEWEYACRAGEAKEKLLNRGEGKDIASYAAHRLPEPREPGKRKANPWGLHDMLGNVWEWTQDAYRANAYATHGLFNPIVKEAPGGERVIRGASHRSEHLQVRCANRGSYPAADTLRQIGLRLVRTR